MGIIRNGILGGFTNKTGPLVGVKFRGINVIKSVPLKNLKAPTVPQLHQRLKFGKVSSFLSDISELITIGFLPERGKTSPMNAAIAYNLAHAIADDEENPGIDYARISFSDGKLALPENTAIEAFAGHEIEFSWFYNETENRFLAPGDRCTVLVYNPAKNAFVSSVDAAARVERFFSLKLPEFFIGDTVHCYLSFNSIKIRKLVSKSIYIGQVIVF